jgi:bifunctional DNA-binding transcriptional regulator/antitoxin component of YhaV-PrlF toxin-antitoxin module
VATTRLRRSKYERKLGKTGHAVINQKRRLTLPQNALSESGLRDGDLVRARADGSGRIVLEKAGIPVWAEPT